MEPLSIEQIPICSIDPEGVYKYVQISCNNKIYVRGIAKYKFHKGVYNSFKRELAQLNIKYPTRVLGGGRIQMTPLQKKIFVYGYSNAYGRCKHSKTCEILKTKYPDYTITWSNNGY